MLVISHRGYHVNLPENTLAAFAAAAALGVDGIETDIRLTADGQAILFHDHLTPDGRPLAEVSHAELSRVAGYDVPTAESALAQFPDVLWNLEIKVPAALNATLELIDRYRGSRQLFITSFWHNLIDSVASQFDVDCGWLVSHRPRLPPMTGTPRVRTIVWYYETMDPELIAIRKQIGLRNMAYGVITPAEHARCRELGLDGVITDRPEYCAIAADGT